MSSAIAAPMCKTLGIKFINGCIRSGSAITRNAIRARVTFLLSDWIIANSYAGLKACEIISPKSKVIYNALDPQRLDLINDKEYVSKKNLPITVVMAARMTAQKNFSMFIDGAREINKIDPGNWKFIAIGDGEDKNDLISKAADLVSSGVMEFPEVIDEVIPQLQQADIGVLLTNNNMHKEGLSNSIMEYMFCGLPVICHDNGGNNELVVSGETGFLLKSNNIHNLVEYLHWLAHHPAEARQMGESGKKRITELCSIRRMVSEYIEVYQDVLHNKNVT
jgi:glycosyltransferase involved in cell wall biosynthesis